MSDLIRSFVLAAAIICLLAGTASAAIGHSRTLVFEYDVDEGIIVGYESLLTIDVFGGITIGAGVGPELVLNQKELRWHNDVFLSFSDWVVGVNWGRRPNPRLYAMYTF